MHGTPVISHPCLATWQNGIGGNFQRLPSLCAQCALHITHDHHSVMPTPNSCLCQVTLFRATTKLYSFYLEFDNSILSSNILLLVMGDRSNCDFYLTHLRRFSKAAHSRFYFLSFHHGKGRKSLNYSVLMGKCLSQRYCVLPMGVDLAWEDHEYCWQL